jgi:DNA-binding SARP family transcriptional activator
VPQEQQLLTPSPEDKGEGAMAVLSITLFGKFCIRQDDEEIGGLEARRARDLFCYLLLYRDRKHARESLAGLIGGDTPSVHQKKSLRQALWQIQSVLDPNGSLGPPPVLTVEPDWIQVSPKANVWLDVAAFEQGYYRLKGVGGRDLDRNQFDLLQTTLQLYSGNLLEDCFEDWCIFERERLQGMYLALLDKIIDYCETRRDYDTGLAYAEIVLRYDYARERTHRRLMRLHYLAGDRTAALRQYERCQAALAKELAVSPSVSTVSLYERIRADDLAPTDPPEVVHGSSTLPDVLGRLSQLQKALADLQRQVQADVEAIEAAVKSQVSTTS